MTATIEALGKRLGFSVTFHEPGIIDKYAPELVCTVTEMDVELPQVGFGYTGTIGECLAFLSGWELAKIHRAPMHG